jgi:hypothetical protein
MSQLFNFSFQTLAGAPDSPGAINRNQVVYAYATQSTKTLLVFTNGDSRIANNTLASVKSTFGLTSIGSPTSVNGQIVSLGEVLVNQDYVTQVFDNTSTRRVEMNQPASSPVNFTTSATLTGLVANSFAGEKGYKEWIGIFAIPSGTSSAVTATPFYNTIGVNPTVTFSTGAVNTVGATGTGFYTIDFPGVLTTGNLTTSWDILAKVPSAASQNVASIGRIDYGTTEATGSIVMSFWSGSTTTTSPAAAVAGGFLSNYPAGGSPLRVQVRVIYFG